MTSPLLIVLLCLVPQGSQKGKKPQQSGPRPTPKVHEIATDLANLVLQRRPWKAIQNGIPRTRAQRLGRYGTVALEWWTDELEDLQVRRSEISRRNLTPKELAEYEAMGAWLEMETVLILARTPERWNAASYVDRVVRMLRVALRADWLTLEQRWAEVGRVLTEMPPFWQAAEHGLVSPRNPWTTEAITSLVDLVDFLDNDLRDLIEDAPPEVKRESLEDKLDAAILRTEAFRQWLLDSPKSLGGASTLVGRQNWQRLIRAVSGTERSIAEIKTSLLREIASLERERGIEWRPRPPTYEELDPDRLTFAVKNASNNAIRVAVEAKLLEETNPGRFELVPALARGLRYFGINQLLVGRGARQTLLLEPVNTDWSPEVSRTRGSFFTDEGQICLGIRFGFPGEALLRAHAQESGDPVVQFLVNRSVLEGWGLYALDWMMRIDWVENPLIEDEDVRAEAVRGRMVEAIRLLAALEVHAEGMSVPEAIEAYRRRSGFDAETAAEEIAAAVADPLVGIGYLGYLQLLALEQELARELDPSEALARTLGMVLPRPHLRPSDIRRALMTTGSR